MEKDEIARLSNEELDTATAKLLGKEIPKKLPTMEDVIVVTMDNVPSKNIVKVIGLVSYAQNHADIKDHEKALKKRAYEIGANAVIGVKISYMSDYVKDVTGTAVVVQ
jgi:uncharacterized protein YbjQ (UPF0145 family)